MPASRRALLLGSAAAASVLGLGLRKLSPRAPSSPGQALPSTPPPPAASAAPPGPPSLPAGAFAALEALQERLLPSVEGSPSASSVGAARYLDGLMARGELEPGSSERLLWGLAQLDEMAVASGAAAFSLLSASAQDEAIRALYQRGEQGRAFHELVLEGTLEAFLGDPSHGGNPRGVVWAWLGIQPGAPRGGAR